LGDREDMELDDQELEKLHQAAVQGELRRKRRHRGIGLDDSDDESDEDERARKIRRKMNKSQRIDRDNIKALGQEQPILRAPLLTPCNQPTTRKQLHFTENMSMAFLTMMALRFSTILLWGTPETMIAKGPRTM